MVAVQTVNAAGQAQTTMIPSIANVQAAYAVTLNAMAQTKWTLYDSVSYPAAGATVLNFFNFQVGAGVGFGGAAKTNSDTNLTMPNSLPSTQKFLIECISLEVQPSTPSGAGIQDPGFHGAANATGVPPINDAWYILRSGNFTLTIASVPYTQEAPIYALPPISFPRIDAALSDSTTPAAAAATQIALMSAYGSPYVLDPNNLLIEANMNFNATLTWPEGMQAVNKPARIFCKLSGTLYRNVQ
jgi:hypothetical protein